MLARVLAFVLITASLAGAAEPESASDLRYIRPDGWARTDKDALHLVILSPDAHSSATFIAGQDFSGTPETWHDQLWKELTSDLTPRASATPGKRGDFQTTWAAFNKADGTQSWICLYTLVKSGRGEGVLFWADGEEPFRANFAAVNRLIDSVTFVPPEKTAVAASPPSNEPAADANPPGVADAPPPPAPPEKSEPPSLPENGAPPAPPPSSSPDAAPPAATDAPQSTELTVEVPPGWSRTDDAKTRTTYLIPPDSRSVREAGLAIFPVLNYDGSAQRFHAKMLNTALRGCQLLEPVRSGSLAGGLLVSVAHYTTPRGGSFRFVLYTAQWGTHAQAAMFATARDNFFNNDGPAADAVMRRAQVPTAANPPAPAAPVSFFDAPASATPPGVNGSSGAALSAPPPASAPPAASTGGDNPGDTVPVLNYAEPANFYRGGSKYPYEYTCNDINFAICVYPFRPFTGDIAATFQQNLLRDWVDVRYREEALAGPPQFGQDRVPGADAVYEARFQEQIVGPASLRMRVLIVAGNMAAMVDAKAPTAFAWQKEAPALQALLASLRVDRKAAPPSVTSGPGPEGAALAGLYVGTKLKYMVNLNRMAGFGDTVPARHFYLFSADGRVFRCYDNPPAGGDWRQFDFDSAQRDDPINSGRFTVRDRQLYLEMGSQPGQPPNVITATLGDPNELEIESVKYVRSR